MSRRDQVVGQVKEFEAFVGLPILTLLERLRAADECNPPFSHKQLFSLGIKELGEQEFAVVEFRPTTVAFLIAVGSWQQLHAEMDVVGIDVEAVGKEGAAEAPAGNEER